MYPVYAFIWTLLLHQGPWPGPVDYEIPQQQNIFDIAGIYVPTEVSHINIMHDHVVT